MRILTRKLYRAFPELDHFSDVQCRRLMRRVQLDAWAKSAVRISPLVAFFVAFIIVHVFFFATDIFAPARSLFRDGDLLFILLLGFGVPALVGALARDRVLRRFLIRAIRLRIDRVRCLGCKYILIGQRAEEGTVTCPECGRINLLRELGIAEADLVPPQSELDWLTSEEAADRQRD